MPTDIAMLQPYRTTTYIHNIRIAGTGNHFNIALAGKYLHHYHAALREDLVRGWMDCEDGGVRLEESELLAGDQQF